MRGPLLLTLLFALAVASGCGGDSDDESGRDGDPPAASAPQIEQLRRGGYVVVFRHAATDTGMDTTDDLSDCSRQRNLSAEGRRQSRTIGSVFRRVEIPVGQVLASPFCRTRDTARIAFGRVRSSRALLSPEFFEQTGGDRPRGLQRLLAVRPPGRSNTVLVSHGSAIYEATGLDPEEGDAVVARPGRGRRGFRIVSTIKVDAWGRAAP
jgi:phosphohistidine phosphatase SixA